MERHHTLARCEWIELAARTTIVASPERAWMFRGEALAAPAEPFALTTAEAEARTRRLFDGAIAAAFPVARPDAVPPLTPVRWVLRLAGLYHLTHHTPRLLRIAGARFHRDGRQALADWATQRAREESNHDVLALRDLRAMGYDADAVVRTLRPEPAMSLLAFFERTATADDPIECVGYAYAVERLAMTVDRSEIEKIEALLPVRATRCLRVHSAIGSDADHVADTVRVAAQLGPDERRSIALACHRTARLCFAPPVDGFVDDDAIAAALA